jgi:hypothetical protein
MPITTKGLPLGDSVYPTAIGAGSHDNYDAIPALAGFGIAYLTNAAASTLTGLVAGADGDLLLIVVRDAVGAFALAQESSSSLPPNRFNFALNFAFGRGGVLLRYDGALSRWTRVWAATG